MNMIPEKAIEKAIEGGWISAFSEGQLVAKHADKIIPAMWQVYALDKAFWPSLGKALGWSAGDVRQGCCEVCGEPMPEGEEMFKLHGYSSDCLKPPIRVVLWKDEAYRFYDLILTSGAAEAFWNELLGEQL